MYHDRQSGNAEIGELADDADAQVVEQGLREGDQRNQNDFDFEFDVFAEGLRIEAELRHHGVDQKL